MENPIISFCIPTYNRCQLLSENISEIIKQSTENEVYTEICISDNCSTDDTSILIRSLPESPFSKIVYHVNDSNIGPDLNYLKSVELASSELCWFLGSDDKLAEGSLKRFLDQHKSNNSDIYLCERIDCNIDMRPFGRTKWCKINHQMSFQLNDTNELIDYLKKSISLGAVFSYLSSIIFNKKIWDLIEYDHQFTGTAYSHVYKLLKFKDYNTKLTYIPDAMVLCRHGNDHFLANGYTRRFLIDIDGYLLLGRVLFENKNELQYSFLEIMKKEHDYSYLLFIHSISNSKEWLGILMKLKHYRYNNYFLNITPFVPKKISNILYRANNFKKIIVNKFIQRR